MDGSLELRAGDWVEVRSKEEILATLDARGQLEGLPFMPEMFQYCGRRLQVFKRAHKTCDPARGLQARRMVGAVHLTDVRCGGEAHGGCQAGCLIFWKTAWLKKVDRGESLDAGPVNQGCTEHDVWAAVHRPATAGEMTEPAYVCQSTQVHAATTPLPWWDLRQYAEDVRSGNVRASAVTGAMLFALYHRLTQSGLGVGAAMRWLYDTFQRLRGGTPYPWRRGEIPAGGATPSRRLDLTPGDTVRIRSYPDILATLDEDSRNRGMYFDAEQVPFCNGIFRVLRRVERIIDERTGHMIRLKNDAIVLDDVVCRSRYAKCRYFCPRSIYPYWREIWLDPVSCAAVGASQRAAIGDTAREANVAAGHAP